MRIAVTGATGFLGRYIVHQLARDGHRLRCWHRPGSDRGGFEEAADCHRVAARRLGDLRGGRRTGARRRRRRSRRPAKGPADAATAAPRRLPDVLWAST